MITYDLRRKRVSLDEILHTASSNAVRILAKDGLEYVLERADDLEQEAAMLANSENFSLFLAERGSEPGTVALDDVEKALGH